MTDSFERGAISGSTEAGSTEAVERAVDVDGADSRPFVALTRSEAQALRDRLPQVSPWRVVGAQALAGLLCIVVAWAVAQRSGVVWSAFYGAAAAVIPSALLARGMTRGTRNPVAAAAGFMFWEVLKIGVAVAMLVIAAKVVPQISWPALLATMVVCMKVNWLALLWRGRVKNIEGR